MSAPRHGFFRALVVLSLLVLSSARASATDFIVSKTADTADGACNADCSLREAIVAANAAPGADRIVLGSNLTYNLTIGPADPSGALVQGSGDLDIVDALTIDGNGSSISAMGLDRVLDIQGSFLVTINSLSIRDGSASGFLSLGGGLNIRLAAVVLNNCFVNTNNTAVDESGNRDNGGGISVVGSYNAMAGTATLAALTLNNTAVGGNTGQNGGGIFCALCALTVSNSTVSLNTASGGDGGGIDVVGNASTLSVNSSHLITNQANGTAARGGGLSVPFGTSVSTLSRNRIVYNTAAFASAIFDNFGTVTATNNWWGCNFGPGAGGAGCLGTTNGVSGPVTSTPYLVLKTYASPPAIVPNASSTVTADLTFNSANADTSAGGTVPNGLTVTFSGTLGTFATPTSATANGKAANIYTNSGATGSAGISAVLDGQTATTSLLVAFGLPTVVTGAAGGIGGFAATLNGTANPNGSATTANFEYGQTIAYGSTTPAQAIGSGSGFVAIGGGAISGLACGTLYHFRAAATNGSGTTGGLDATFTTSACVPPVVVTGAASAIKRTSATLNGTANPNGGATTANFEYGLTIAYGSTTPVQSLGSGMVAVSIGGGGVTGLLCNTAYHFRAVAANPGGATPGSDAVFTTTACARGDVDGDGRSDVFWRNRATGQNIGWLMNGLTVATASFLPTIADANWEIKGAGDFDGDRRADIIWRNKVSGQDIGWLMNALTVSSAAFLPTIADTNWEIKGVGDVDASGKSDVLLRNRSSGQNIGWLMNGLTVATASFLPTIADTNWGIVGMGDFDGDGKADVVLRNRVTGQNIGWLMNGLAVASSALLPAIADTNWEIKAAGDFNGDGKLDVLWRNRVTGQNIGWLMDGLTISTSAFLPTIADTNWEIKGAGDFDGDLKTDVVWRNRATGQNIGWLMNGLTVSTSSFLVSIADTNWEIVGP